MRTKSSYISIELIDSEQFKASDYFDVLNKFNLMEIGLFHPKERIRVRLKSLITIPGGVPLFVKEPV